MTTIGAFPAGAARVEDVPAPDGMRILHAIGLSDEVLRTLRHLSPDARVPFAEVAHHGEPLYLYSEIQIAAYPEWCGTGICMSPLVILWALILS